METERPEVLQDVNQSHVCEPSALLGSPPEGCGGDEGQRPTDVGCLALLADFRAN